MNSWHTFTLNSVQSFGIFINYAKILRSPSHSIMNFLVGFGYEQIFQFRIIPPKWNYRHSDEAHVPQFGFNCFSSRFEFIEISKQLAFNQIWCNKTHAWILFRLLLFTCFESRLRIRSEKLLFYHEIALMAIIMDYESMAIVINSI